MTNMIRRHGLLIVLFAGVCIALAYGLLRLGPPSFTLAELRLANEGSRFNPYHQTLAIDLKVRNNHILPLQIEDVSVSLSFAGQQVGRVEAPSTTRIPPFGTEVMTSHAWIALRDLAASVLTPERRQYRIETRFRANGEAVVQVREGILGQH